jgi:hypothetical protein
MAHISKLRQPRNLTGYVDRSGTPHGVTSFRRGETPGSD